ncbi:hypothetical protein ACQPW1_39600 [Nocardia sp. CA-128927]|uniref:hypothetical protein n=1 Tax=Nocardia sp. CA-128927 TaxID=3239975 RepID=UPI003D995B75
MAATHGYFLLQVIEFDQSGDAQTHNALMIEHIRAAKAEAVLTANLAHLAGGERAITELCDLITPEQTYPRGHHWPPPVPDSGCVR